MSGGKKTMIVCLACAACLALAGCSGLLPKAPPPPALFALERSTAPLPAPQPGASGAAAPTLVIHAPQAAAGFDSPRMVFARTPHRIEYFAHHEWVDTPARMLGPLLVAALENRAIFRAAWLAPSVAAADWRLDSEIVRLQHDFSALPSRVRFTLRVFLVDNATRQVLAWREFDESVAAASDDPYGGVLAANRAVQAVLVRLAAFCAETATGWQPVPADGRPSSANNRRAP